METKNINVCETFPDGTPIDGWFYDTKYLHGEIGKQYVLTAYGILMMESFTQRKFRH